MPVRICFMVIPPSSFYKYMVINFLYPYGILGKKLWHFDPSNCRKKGEENTVSVTRTLNDYQSQVTSKFQIKASLFNTPKWNSLFSRSER